MEHVTIAAQPTTILLGNSSNTTPTSGLFLQPNLNPAKECKGCFKTFRRGLIEVLGGLCISCHEHEQAVHYAETQAAEMVAGIDRLVSDDMLHVMGLSKREIRAEWSLTPKAIKDAMPRNELLAMYVGHLPSRGFGVGSHTGAGKTMALAAIVRGFQRAYRLDYADRMVTDARKNRLSEIKFEHQVVWHTWPQTVTDLRSHVVDGKAEAILERAEEAPLLVLDDLGRERIKGSYVEDWAASQLDRIINKRYREELPTLWTTNLTPLELNGMYGAALVSRLLEDAPLHWIENAPSMRLK